jgi:hypothetical protein
MFFAISMFSTTTIRSTTIHLDSTLPIVGISLSGYLLKTTLMVGILSPKRCLYLKLLGAIFLTCQSTKIRPRIGSQKTMVMDHGLLIPREF